MAEQRGGQLLWSAALIVGGVIALLFNLNALAAFEPLAQYILAGVLALAGIAFFVSYATAAAFWWRLIPAWTLLALAAMVLLSVLRPGAGRWVAALLFWGLGLAFAHIYLTGRADRWWAILPGGFLTVLGVVVAISGRVTSLELLGAILFVGVGLVFLLLYVAGGANRQWWALIPASILVLFGLFILTLRDEGQTALLRWWPVLVVAGGIFLLWRVLRPRPEPRLEVNRAPAPAAAAPSPLGAPAAAGTSVQVLPDPDE